MGTIQEDLQEDFAILCPGGCGKPIERDGELCRGCLIGANIVNRNAIKRLTAENVALRERLKM